jgi:hypothetical protein
MLTDRTFNVVLVSPSSAIAYSPAAAGRAIDYRGARVDLRF